MALCQVRGMGDRITVNGIALNYRLEGSGSDLVLTHGLGDSLAYWEACVPALAKRHRVLTWDLRGFGASDKPPGPYSPELFAADLAALVRELGIRRAHFAGISLGGVITQRLALDTRDLVRSMVLVSTSSQVGEAAAKGWSRLADQIEAKGFRAGNDAAARGFSKGFAQRHPEIIEAASRATAANDPMAYAAASRAASAYNWTERLREISVPTLILQGAEDQLTPPGGSVIMSRHLRHNCLLIVPECGHNLPIEQRVLFESTTLAFLAGIEMSVKQ